MMQLPLEMPFRRVLGRNDFILSDCNAIAAAMIDQWPDWPGRCRALNLVGPAGAGKSHLAAIWQALLDVDNILTELPADAGLSAEAGQPFFVLDALTDSAAWDEEALFHLFNRCGDDAGGLLLLSETAVGQMNWQLPDLKSRMRAVHVARIDLPDDELLYALLEKYFSERQIVAPPAMLRYLVGRMERSFTAVQMIGKAVDQRSIAEKRPLSVALARDVMGLDSH